MRTGAEYREALRDGRRVWVIGEGLVEDVTVHPATRATVAEYVAWYDRHFDPEWRDILLTPADAQGARAPWAYALPRRVQDLRAMGRSFSARSAGGARIRSCRRSIPTSSSWAGRRGSRTCSSPGGTCS